MTQPRYTFLFMRQSRFRCALAALACLSLQLPLAYPQTPPASQNTSVLERRYQAAQTFQAAHELDKAAQQYRVFIADSLGQLAMGHAYAGLYERSANEFDEALSLVPDFPALRLEYARVSFENGQFERARSLAATVLQASPQDSKVAAKAHALLGRVLLKTGKNAEAKQEIEQAVSLDPTFENGYELAVADLDLGEGDAASQIFAEMLTSFGDTAAIHMLFGQAYGGSDFQAKAVDEFQAAIAKDDRLPGAHYSLASAYLATGGNAKLPEVEAELRKETAVSPGSSAAYAALGHLLANRHAGDEALSALKRATELDPTNPDAYLYLGQFYADAKRPVEAETSLRKSIELTKDPSRNAYQVQKAHYLLGRLLIEDGKTDEGKQEIATSQQLMQKNLSRDQNRLADYLQEKPAPGMGSPGQLDSKVEAQAHVSLAEDANALRMTDKLEKQDGPAIADSYNNLGAIAGSENNYSVALHYFKRAAEWSPALPGLDFNWGRAAFSAGVPAEAVGPLSRYLRMHPEDQGARTVLGLSQFLTKDYAGTQATLNPIVDSAGATPQVRYAYARSLVETNDLSGGVARLLALDKADPGVADVHYALGEAYARQRSPGADREFETAIRLNPEDGEAHAALARLQLAAGNKEAALLHLEEAVKLEPGNADLRQELAQVKAKPR